MTQENMNQRKVNVKQFNEGELQLDETRLENIESYFFRAKLLDAIENWHYMWDKDAEIKELNIPSHYSLMKKRVVLDLRVRGGDEYERWEIVD